MSTPSSSRKRKQKQDQALQEAIQEAATPIQAEHPKLPVRKKGSDSPSITQTKTQLGDISRPTGHMISFDDEEEDLKMKSPKAPPALTIKAKEPNEELPEEESDDEAAPEAVSIQKAASDVKQTLQAAQNTAKETAVLEKRKRQERDALFKQQASKRKLHEGDELSTGKRKRGRKAHIPDVLPAELLDDSSSEDEEQIARPRTSAPKEKKRTVQAIQQQLTQFDQVSTDKVVGSTIYRLAKKTDERLTPKAKTSSSNAKKRLLKRNRVRAPVRKPGFFSK